MDDEDKQGLVYLHVFAEEAIEDAETWAAHHGYPGPKKEVMVSAMKRQLVMGALFQDEAARERLEDYYDRFETKEDGEMIEVTARPEREWDGEKCCCPLCSEMREVDRTFHTYRPANPDQQLLYNNLLGLL